MSFGCNTADRLCCGVVPLSVRPLQVRRTWPSGGRHQSVIRRRKRGSLVSLHTGANYRRMHTHTRAQKRDNKRETASENTWQVV